MTIVNTTDDLLRAARENKEFREAFRREILTEELMTSLMRTLIALRGHAYVKHSPKRAVASVAAGVIPGFG